VELELHQTRVKNRKINTRTKYALTRTICSNENETENINAYFLISNYSENHSYFKNRNTTYKEIIQKKK
jgi:hypothetical protein